MSKRSDIQLPKSWEAVQLCHIATLIRGVSYKKEHVQNSPQDSFVPLLRATNITGSSLTFGELVYVPIGYVSDEQILSDGDIVIAASSGSKEIVGKAGQFMSPAWKGSFGAFCTAIRPESDLNSRFIGYYFQTPGYREVISEGSAGSNINNIKSTDLATHLVPVAPRQEQTRIVEKLEELLSDLDAGVAELKAAQKKLVQYRQSLLKAAVEGKLTQHWREQRSVASPSPQPLSHQGRGAYGVDGVNDAAASYQLHHSEKNATTLQQNPNLRNAPPGKTLPSPLVGEGPGERGQQQPTPPETGAQLLERILKQRRANWEAKQLAKFQQQGKTPPKDWQDKYPKPVKPDTSDLPELPEGWVWASLEQVSEIQGGIQKQPSRTPIKNKFPFLRVANVARGLLKLDEIHEIELFDGELERLALEKGDILIVEGNGSLTEIGRCALWNGSIPNVVHQNHLIRARPINMRSEFVEAWLNSLHGIGKLTKLAATTSGLYTLSVGKISKIPVPVPPILEQSEAVYLLNLGLEEHVRQNELIQLSIKQSTAQRKNILKAAFSGQLVAQDPNEEPASVLLERIRAERVTQQATKAPKKRITKTAL